MKTLQLTEENLNNINEGNYAIFVNSSLMDIICIDDYCKNTKSAWDFYQEYGTQSYKDIVESYNLNYTNHKITFCNILDIKEP